MALKLECGYLKGFIGEHEYAAMASQVENAHALLASGKGPGNDFLGWVDLPTNYDKEEFARIKAAAERIKKNTDVFIVIGIGGSYLGARAFCYGNPGSQRGSRNGSCIYIRRRTW